MKLFALLGTVFLVELFVYFCAARTEDFKFIDDVCGHINGQRIYLEFGESGTLVAKSLNNIFDNFSNTNVQKRCSVEFISCPSCVIKIKFKFLNLPKNCGKPTIFDACGCDYVWIYEPTFEESSEQFCGKFEENNATSLTYISQTRKVVVAFLYNNNYEFAFSLDYFSKRNKIFLTGFPKFGNLNNSSQVFSSPFFPNLYSTDLSMEHVIRCESLNITCRISLVFTDFLIAHSSILDFFDWNGERIYVTTGNIFRPPVITSTGPSLTIRFYANGASNFGYKASYSFILGQVQLKPDIDCGGHVNNLGGGITMMNMIQEGLKSFDCIWLLKPPETYLHMKTHLYVKVVTFSGFAGNTELIIRQGLTSTGPVVEDLKIFYPHFRSSKEKEHIVPISQGFYISLKGVFRQESRLALVYAAFNYKNCLSGADFLCHNQRCISSLLNCDGFDHCGDNSDESVSCTDGPKDRRRWSKTPNFFFPQVEALTDLTTSTLIFLFCSFGLIGFIFAMIIFLYRINLKTRHQRHIQDHIETIQAILEEGGGEVEEEIIIPDDPPDYEAPPDYDEVVRMCIEAKAKNLKRCSRCNSMKKLKDKGSVTNQKAEKDNQGTSRSCQTTPVPIPDSPPPAYEPEGMRIRSFDESQGTNELMDTGIHQKLKKCISENLLNRRNLNYKIQNTWTKYLSDSYLIYNSNFNDDHGPSICRKVVTFPKFDKSFTTDDM